MVLVLPDPEVTIGPDWANDLNTALERVDLHDHSNNFGVQVTPAGLNINTDLPFNANNATLLRSLRLVTQSAVLSSATDKGCVYEVNGDLYYNNAAGTAVQITSGGAIVSPGSGAITSKALSSFPYTVLTSDAQKVLLVNTTAAAVTVNFPAATTNMFFAIRDIGFNASTHNISAVPNGTDTIEGSNSTYLLNVSGASWSFISDGVSAWYII